eukprot:32675_1
MSAMEEEELWYTDHQQMYIAYIEPIQLTMQIICFLGSFIVLVDFCRRLWKQETSRSRTKKIISFCALSMFLSTTLSLLYVFLFHRIMSIMDMDRTVSNCTYHQVAIVSFYTWIRISYYLFLTFRLEIAFRDSNIVKINKRNIAIFRVLILVGSMGICLWNIIVIRVEPYGMFCNCTYPPSIMLFYAAFDFSISASLVYLFASKLYQITKWFESLGDVSAQRRVFCEKLVFKIKMLTFLALVSIISTWLLVIVGNGFWEPLTWFTELDYLLNVLCVYVMFEFVRLRGRLRIAESIGCFGSKYCCWCWCCIPFRYICWSNKIRTEMNALSVPKHKKSIKLGSTSNNIGATSATESPQPDDTTTQPTI